MESIPKHTDAQRAPTPDVDSSRPSAARSHSAVVGPDVEYQRHTDQLAANADNESLSGRGRGGQRFGGMGQAGIRDGNQDEPFGMQRRPGAQQDETKQSDNIAELERTGFAQPTSAAPTAGSDSDGVSSDEESRAAAQALKRHRGSAGLIDTEAEMGIGGAGYGRMAASLDDAEQRKEQEKGGNSKKFWSGGSKSSTGPGGMGSGYMRYVRSVIAFREGCAC